MGHLDLALPATLVDAVLAWDARAETLSNAARILSFERRLALRSTA